MDGKINHSNKGKSSDRWLNLMLAVLTTFFLIYIGRPLIQGDWSQATDYYAFYNAGKIINEGEFADIYNLEILADLERELLVDIDGQVGEDFVVNPVQYPPVFLWIFSLFAWMDFPISLLVWSGTNFLVLVGYLWFFARKVSGKVPTAQLLLLFLVTFPVLHSFHYGQVNVWLLICAGEFLRMSLSKKPWPAGLWLGGLLIKPHLLILLLPFLLIQKRYKEIAGFIISAIAVFGLSFILVGFDGFIALKDVMFQAAQGGVSSGFQFMMNWRMLSHYVGLLSSPIVGNVVLIVLTVVTAVLPLIVFRKKIAEDSPRFAVAMLGVLAATTAVTYHIHVHTAMILIPILLYLTLQEMISFKWILVWCLVPILLFFTQYFLTALLVLGLLPEAFAYFVVISYGMGMLVVNMILLIWSLKHPSGVKKISNLEQPA